MFCELNSNNTSYVKKLNFGNKTFQLSFEFLSLYVNW